MLYYFVYILKCSDNSYYVGVTNNLERRLEEHIIGTNPNSYTFKRRPVTYKFHTKFSDINEAIAFEKRIKKWSRAKKEALIEGRYSDLPKLSRSLEKGRN